MRSKTDLMKAAERLACSDDGGDHDPIAVSRPPGILTGVETTPDDDRHHLAPLAAAVDAAPGPLERLAALRDLEDAVAADEAATVAAARARNASWAAVGAGLRRSKQAVARKYGIPVERDQAGLDVEPAPRERKPASWDVQTPRGRTLLRVVKRR